MDNNPVIAELIRTGVFTAGNRRLPVKHCIPAATGEALYRVIVTNGFTQCLEVGCLFGYSTLFLAQALSETGGRLTVVDIAPDHALRAAAETHVRQAGYETIVDFRWGDSMAILPALTETYQFAFIDADHHFPAVMADIVHVDRLLTVGGVMALDDVGMVQAPHDFLGGASHAMAHLFATNRYHIHAISDNACLCRKLRSLDVPTPAR